LKPQTAPGLRRPNPTSPVLPALSMRPMRRFAVGWICHLLTCRFSSRCGYEYERPFDQRLLPPDWVSGYRPDFYYPGINCWHEHFGINKLGKAPPWVSKRGTKHQRTYEDEVVQKREVLSDSGVDWSRQRAPILKTVPGGRFFNES
jgi:hypothetical protein